MRLLIRVSPGAPRPKILGWRGDRLKIAVAAPPEAGRANDALVAYLAEVLNVNRRSVRLVAGHASRDKTVEIPDDAAPRVPS